MNFDKDKILKAMIETGQDEDMAKEIIKSYKKMDERLQEVLMTWVNEKKILPFEFEGVSIEYIMNKKKCNIFYALTSMSVFLKEPELAKKFREKPIFHKGKRK